jgi:hypothetical protein
MKVAGIRLLDDDPGIAIAAASKVDIRLSVIAISRLYAIGEGVSSGDDLGSSSPSVFAISPRT